MAKNNLKPGDLVRFMNDVGGGKVTAVLSDDMVTVETEDGFEIPTYNRNLVLIETTGQQKDSPAKPISREEEYERTSIPRDLYKEVKKNPGFRETGQAKNSDIPEFIFALVPDNPANPEGGKMTLYLVNDCNFTLIYHFATIAEDKYLTVDAGILEPNTKIELDTIHPGGLGEIPGYCFQLLYFRKSAEQLEEPVQKEIRISPVKFFRQSSFTRNRYFDQPAMLIRLADHPLKAELEKLTDRDFDLITGEKDPRKSATAALPKPELAEVDLHIDQLLDDKRGLSNADMLKHQLDTFRAEMGKAIETGLRRIVFIHGVGDGVLKKELRKELSRRYPKYPFQDASFREYGFGATLVILKK